jgi:Raf kinase inhibitor-like YbhB/YbcL family protein
MTLASGAFRPGEEMDQKHGKKLDNVSLPFAWAGQPEGTRSFALILVDRDARDYVHWLVSEIPAGTEALAEGAAGGGQLPAGAVERKASAGPFPPSGTHRYEAILVALGIERLDLPGRVDLATFSAATEPHAVATAATIGTFTKRRDQATGR